MTEEIKDYVFYIITKEYECWKSEGFTLGIKRLSSCVRHSKYFEWLKDSEPVFFKGISSDWSIGLEQLAKDGNVTFANSAIEVEELKERLYTIILPSFLSKFQIEELRKHMTEFESLNIFVEVVGENRATFLKKIEESDYTPIEFLKNYLQLYEEKSENLSVIEKGVQKIMC